MDKEGVAHIYNGILLSHKKKWNWVTCNKVDGPRVCHTEGNKSEREKQILYGNIYMESKEKNGSEEPRGRTGIKTKDADVENGLEDTGRGKGKLGRSERVAWTYIHYEM